MALTKVRGNGLGTVNTADLDGAVTVNDSSADVDFRVESNGSINMLHVDGGSEVVTIGGLTGTAGNEHAGYSPLQIGNTADSSPIVQFLSTTSGTNTIHFGDAVSGAGRYAGYQMYDHSNNHMRFGTGGNDNLRLTNTVSGTTSEFSNPFAIESHPIMAIRTESNSGANHDTYYDFPVETNGGCYVIAFSNHDQSPGSYGIFKNFQVAHNSTYISTQASEAYGGNGSVTATKPSSNVLRITFDKSDTSNSSNGYSTIECVAVFGANPF